jgi:hypothetical protein
MKIFIQSIRGHRSVVGLISKLVSQLRYARSSAPLAISRHYDRKKLSSRCISQRSKIEMKIASSPAISVCSVCVPVSSSATAMSSVTKFLEGCGKKLTTIPRQMHGPRDDFHISERWMAALKLPTHALELKL